jgi:hypothetical protein
MRNRIKQRMLRRIALAFAVAAVVAPTAQAVPLEPGATKAEYIPFVTDFPRGNTAPHGETIQAGEYGMPRAMPTDYAANRGDRIELARLNDRVGSDVRGLDRVELARLNDRVGSDVRAIDRVENVRVEPRGLDKPVLVSDTRSFDWGDAGIGAGLAFAAILLAGAAALSARQYDRLGQV